MQRHTCYMNMSATVILPKSSMYPINPAYFTNSELNRRTRLRLYVEDVKTLARGESILMWDRLAAYHINSIIYDNLCGTDELKRSEKTGYAKSRRTKVYK